jgi:hypothetical protein
MSEFSVIVKIEAVKGPYFSGHKQITIPCRDEAHAEAVGKIIVSCAEQEKKIALESAGDKNNV